MRSQALLNETVAATHLGYTFSAPLISKGFTNLGDLAKLPIPFQSTGILTTRRYMNASPEVVENMLRGLVDSLHFIAQPENKPAVLKSLMKGLRLQKVEQAMEGYDTLANIYERKIYPRADGVRNVIRLLGQTNEKIRKLKAEELVDDRFVRKLEKEGSSNRPRFLVALAMTVELTGAPFSLEFACYGISSSSLPNPFTFCRICSRFCTDQTRAGTA